MHYEQKSRIFHYCIDAGNDWNFFWFSHTSQGAKKSDEIIPYLEERFKQENIPVIEITIIERLPLRLRVTVQGSGKWSGPGNSAVWKSIQRAVFLDAHQDGHTEMISFQFPYLSDDREMDLLDP